MNAPVRKPIGSTIIRPYLNVIDGAMQLVGFRPPSAGPDYARFYLTIALGLIPPITAILLFRKYVLKGRKK